MTGEAAREAILHALGEARRLELRGDVPEPAPSPIPARAQLDPSAQIDLFVRYAEAAQAGVTRVAGGEALPGALADLLALQNLPPQVRLAPELADFPWARQPMLDIAFGPAGPADPVGVTGAFAGIAETGSLLLTSGADSPSTLTMLPETHVAVLRTDQIVGTMEDAWARMRLQYGAGAMPRTAIFITGPSRTADIELTMFLGAHGPRRLHILLVDAEPLG